MSEKSQEESGWRGFLNLCCRFRRPEELRELFDLFFTLEEKQDLSKRYLLVKALLDEKMTQREIAPALHVSISKITRGSNALKMISHRLKGALKNIMLP